MGEDESGRMGQVMDKLQGQRQELIDVRLRLSEEVIIVIAFKRKQIIMNKSLRNWLEVLQRTTCDLTW